MQRCHWHPNMDTALTCGSCGKPICTGCVIQHPVGIRCRECARFQRLPTFQVSPNLYLRAVGTALGLGIVGGVVILLVDLLPGLGFFRFLLFLGIGYAVGEGVSGAAKRRRARSLQVIAGLGVVVSVAFEAVVLVGGFTLLGGVFGLLALLAGIWVAVSRVGAP